MKAKPLSFRAHRCNHKSRSHGKRLHQTRGNRHQRWRDRYQQTQGAAARAEELTVDALGSKDELETRTKTTAASYDDCGREVKRSHEFKSNFSTVAVL